MPTIAGASRLDAGLAYDGATCDSRHRQVLWHPLRRNAGPAGCSQWTDADGPEDAVRRTLGDEDVP